MILKIQIHNVMIGTPILFYYKKLQCTRKSQLHDGDTSHNRGGAGVKKVVKRIKCEHLKVLCSLFSQLRLPPAPPSLPLSLSLSLSLSLYRRERKPTAMVVDIVVIGLFVLLLLILLVLFACKSWRFLCPSFRARKIKVSFNLLPCYSLQLCCMVVIF